MGHTYGLKLPTVKNIRDINPDTLYVSYRTVYNKSVRQVCRFPEIYHTLQEFPINPEAEDQAVHTPTLKVQWLVPEFTYNGDSVTAVTEDRLKVTYHIKNGKFFVSSRSAYHRFRYNLQSNIHVCTKEFLEGFQQDYLDKAARLRTQLDAIENAKFMAGW